MDHFLHRLFTISEKLKEIYGWIRSFNFLQSASSTSVILSSSNICEEVSNASCRVRFFESVGIGKLNDVRYKQLLSLKLCFVAF